MRRVRLFARRTACMGSVTLIYFLSVNVSTAQQGRNIEQVPLPRVAGTNLKVPAEPGQLAILSKEAYLVPPKEIADAVLAAQRTSRAKVRKRRCLTVAKEVTASHFVETPGGGKSAGEI